MRMNLSKALALILCFCLCMSLSPLPAAAEDTEMALTLSDAETFDAAKGTHINATNFPDPVFRQFVEDSFDTDGDLVLTEEEVADVTEINVRAKGIASLKGIWAFPNLVTLNCSDNNLRELDVSDLPFLENLYCQDNATPVDRTAAPEAQNQPNGLEYLLPSQALRVLWCYNNNLTWEGMNLALCPDLRELNCSINPVGTMDLSKVPHLLDLRCNNAGLAELDLSPVPDLNVLWCWNDTNRVAASVLNTIQRIDLSACPLLVNVVANGIQENYLFHAAFFDNDATAEVSVPYSYEGSDGESTTTLMTLYLGEELGEFVVRQPGSSQDDEPTLEINEVNFPDEVLREAVQDYDRNGDGMLSDAEIANISYLYLADIASQIYYGEDGSTTEIPEQKIASLEGIRYLTSLHTLEVLGSEITIIDVHGIETLGTLNVEQCPMLTELDVSGCTALTNLQSPSNILTNLDVSGCTALTNLNCSSNTLTDLNVSGCTALTDLNCSSNTLTDLNVSGCTSLTDLNCSSNALTDLNVSGCTALVNLNCSYNQLTGLSLNNHEALTTLKCAQNSLETLNISSCPALTTADCSQNQLRSLDVSHNTALTSLNCSENQLRGLNVQNCAALETLSCQDNTGIGQLMITNNTALTSLNCSNTGLSSLALGENDALVTLACAGNSLTALHIDNCHELAVLNCGDNQIPTLDIGACPRLLTAATEGQETEENGEKIYTYQNYQGDGTPADLMTITSPRQFVLQIDSTTSLITVEKDPGYLQTHFPDTAFRNFVRENCDLDGDGALSSEEISAVTAMNVSELYITDLTGIELFTELRLLNCSWNKLTSLDVSMLPHLQELYCQNNSSNAFYLITQAPEVPEQAEGGFAAADTASYDAPLSSNGIETLIIGSAPLRVLWCYDNNLSALDLSRCSTIEDLDCAFNNISSLDVSGLQYLTKLMCHDNSLTGLDVSANPELTYLWCWNNAFGTLDISRCPKLVNAVNYGSKEFFTDHVSLFDQEAELSLSPDTILFGGSAQAGIPLDEAHFPDKNFRDAVHFAADTDFDGILTDNEIAALSYFDCSALEISSLAGVNYLTGLSVLRCRINHLTELDVSGLSNLIELDCSYNRIGSLDLSGNPMLMRLRAVNNGLNELNISTNTMLRHLWCWFNNIPTLDLRSNPTLSNLVVYGITERYGGGTGGYYDDNGEYHEVEIPSYTCYYDKGETCDLSVDDTVELLSFAVLPINEENFPDAAFRGYVMDFDEDRDTALSKEEIAAVLEINVSDMGIKSLKGLENFTAVESLDCARNELTALDISANTALNSLNCSENSLTNLDTSRNPALHTLDCSHNHLENVRFSNNYELESLDCRHNSLKTINLVDCDTIADFLRTEPALSLDDFCIWFEGEFQREGEGIRSMFVAFDLKTAVCIEYPVPDCVLPSDLRTIEAEAFAGCGFSCVMLKEGVTAIGARAFADSAELAAVYIPESVQEIAASAFENVPRLAIIGDPDSFAAEYAHDHNIIFFAVS